LQAQSGDNILEFTAPDKDSIPRVKKDIDELTVSIEKEIAAQKKAT
jgi:hypothetical protein